MSQSKPRRHIYKFSKTQTINFRSALQKCSYGGRKGESEVVVQSEEVQILTSWIANSTYFLEMITGVLDRQLLLLLFAFGGKNVEAIVCTTADVAVIFFCPPKSTCFVHALEI